MASRSQLSFYRDLLHKPVVDRDGRRIGAVTDLAAGPAPAPAVERLLVRRGRNGSADLLVLPWDAVAAVEPRCVRLHESQATLNRAPLPGDAVLLRRHVMDQQIVDARGAKLERVNDLRMAISEHGLLLDSMDTGFRGLLTRLGYRWGLLPLVRPLYRRVRPHEIAWNLVARVEPTRGHIRLRLTRDGLSAVRDGHA